MVIGVPVILFFAWDQGATHSPEETTIRNGNRIVATLAVYHERTGIYPASLVELVPATLDPLPSARTTQGTGWLHATAEGEFTLGYWRWPDKTGADVCLYRSQIRAWNCAHNGWGPFNAVATPGP